MLAAAGLSAEHAETVADGLTQAELRGQGSHGVSRLLDIYVKRLRVGATNPQPQPTVVSQRGGTALVDGDNGPGHVVGMYAMSLAIDLARRIRRQLRGRASQQSLWRGGFLSAARAWKQA